MIEFILFIFGICIGSFLNVCIYRLPHSKSIVHPPSACPGCDTPIRFPDVISKFILILFFKVPIKGWNDEENEIQGHYE